jgi:hypothetical protein
MINFVIVIAILNFGLLNAFKLQINSFKLDGIKSIWLELALIKSEAN